MKPKKKKVTDPNPKGWLQPEAGRKKYPRVFHNFDPNLRTQEKAVEYVRALNAAKLEKIFARPFIGAMDGHRDSVSCMAKNPNHLKGIFSGSMDGDIRLWDIASSVRLWSVPIAAAMESDGISDSSNKPLAVHVSKNAFWAADHQWDGDLFATAGAQVDIWDHNRSQPVKSFEWGSDTVISVRFNPGEPNILATSASDRSITVYDLRMDSPARKLIMRTRTNSISWNPMEPMNFTASSTSYAYRQMKIAIAIAMMLENWMKPNVSTKIMLDIDYSPTGREFVTGSYDRTVRIFQYNGGHSREIYHTKRMQRVFCVKFSWDASYVISGSDDTNLRLWKAKASEQLGVILPRERKKHEYMEAVKNRYKHLPEVKRITRHRHLPKPVYKASALRRIMAAAERRKEDRRRAHSTPGSMPKESMVEDELRKIS
ncbi:hypothetical protein RJ639_023202 [Escallonia herrerae]|uniref:DDB1- and CUL4-associated factor 13 n=1 Tax=Escallonia herrerae TaxID=1293975 RepID=A0AA88V0J3_9ASTE|nr:hypothetical protein RJ639_023202 [Escallonia herrerae]